MEVVCSSWFLRLTMFLKFFECSTRNMAKILWTCWMECFHLFCWILVTTVSLLLVMPLGSPPSILAGDLMVTACLILVFQIYLCLMSWILFDDFTFSFYYSGSVWISSELKGLNDDCEHFECFPPGHLYSSKSGGLRRWYNPPWFCEAIPSTPYDPLVLRRAFEKVKTNM